MVEVISLVSSYIGKVNSLILSTQQWYAELKTLQRQHHTYLSPRFKIL